MTAGDLFLFVHYVTGFFTKLILNIYLFLVNSRNGVCGTDKTCACLPQFTGPACGVFNFKPVDLAKGTGLKSVDPTTGFRSSWGGSVHLGEFHDLFILCISKRYRY